MKLYTEEQVNELRRALRDIAQWDEDLEDDWEDAGNRAMDALRCFEKQTPIELPSDEDIWRWWQTQKFQKEQGEQEYTMLYEIDLPKILKSFTEHLIQADNK